MCSRDLYVPLTRTASACARAASASPILEPGSPRRRSYKVLVFGYVISNLAIGQILGKRKYKEYMKYILIQKILTPILGLGFFFIFGFEYVIIGLALSYHPPDVRAVVNGRRGFGFLCRGIDIDNYCLLIFLEFSLIFVYV